MWVFRLAWQEFILLRVEPRLDSWARSVRRFVHAVMRHHRGDWISYSCFPIHYVHTAFLVWPTAEPNVEDFQLTRFYPLHLQYKFTYRHTNQIQCWIRLLTGTRRCLLFLRTTFYSAALLSPAFLVFSTTGYGSVSWSSNCYILFLFSVIPYL